MESTTPERLKVIRLAHANQTVIGPLVEGDKDIRSAFERVVDLLVRDDATAEERLLTRMAFDTVSAALLSAQGTDAGPDGVIAAARRATIALTRATTQYTDQGESSGPA